MGFETVLLSQSHHAISTKTAGGFQCKKQLLWKVSMCHSPQVKYFTSCYSIWQASSSQTPPRKKKEHTCKSWEKRSVYPLLYKQILTLLTDATAVHFWSLIALVEDRVKCACMNSLFALTQQCIYNRYHSNSTLNNDTLNASILESDAHNLQRGTEENILAAKCTVKQ